LTYFIELLIFKLGDYHIKGLIYSNIIFYPQKQTDPVIYRYFRFSEGVGFFSKVNIVLTFVCVHTNNRIVQPILKKRVHLINVVNIFGVIKPQCVIKSFARKIRNKIVTFEK